MNNDLISRQAAIDAILHITNCKSVRELFEYNQLHHLTEMWSGGVNDAIDAVIGVDSAQLGTNLAEVGTDCISRQDALEAFGLSEKTRKYGGDHSGYDTMMMYEIQDTIEDLPPIQSEIIRCRECKFASGDSRICMKFDHSPIGELDFCAWAERRTDER